MTTPSEEEARAAAVAAYGNTFAQPLSAGAVRNARIQAFQSGYAKGYLAALASRVSTPPSEDWEYATARMAPAGEGDIAMTIPEVRSVLERLDRTIVAQGPDDLWVQTANALRFLLSQVESGVPGQCRDEDDIEYLDRMRRQRPDLSLDDLGFVEGNEDAPTVDEVREPSDVHVEAAARAGFEHVRNLRPEYHGPYRTWAEESEDYREYLRGIQRAALSALPVLPTEPEERDPEPLPSDGPDYHAEHAAWLSRQESGGSDS